MRLPRILDLAAAAPLWSALSEARLNAAPEVDAADVERLGGLCAQVLTAAAHAQPGLRIVNASPAFLECARTLGAAQLVLLGERG